MELMEHTSKNLKKIFLDRLEKINYNPIKTRGMRLMCERLWEECDDVWIKYEINKATYEQWEKALDKWLNAEEV